MEQECELRRNLKDSKGEALVHEVQEGLQKPSWRLRRGGAFVA
jgi:hypothetical protein